MFCRKCGSKLAEGARYCHMCGVPSIGIREEEFSLGAEKLVEKVKELVHEGNVTRIMVKDESGKVLLDLPVTAGIAGLVLAPLLAAVGAVAAIATKCTLVIERRSVGKPADSSLP